MEQNPYNIAFEDAKKMINSKASYVHVDVLGVELSSRGVKKVNLLIEWPRDMFQTTTNAPAGVAERRRDEWLLFKIPWPGEIGHITKHSHPVCKINADRGPNGEHFPCFHEQRG